MPIYSWSCDVCKKEAEVIRAFSDYEKPPVGEELGNEEDSEKCVHVWTRDIGANQTLVRGPGYGSGRKGHW